MIYKRGKIKQEDVNADIEMFFQQIISLTDLMLENNNTVIPNILTIRDLAISGLNKLNNLSDY